MPQYSDVIKANAKLFKDSSGVCMTIYDLIDDDTQDNLNAVHRLRRIKRNYPNVGLKNKKRLL